MCVGVDQPRQQRPLAQVHHPRAGIALAQVCGRPHSDDAPSLGGDRAIGNRLRAHREDVAGSVKGDGHVVVTTFRSAM